MTGDIKNPCPKCGLPQEEGFHVCRNKTQEQVTMPFMPKQQGDYTALTMSGEKVRGWYFVMGQTQHFIITNPRKVRDGHLHNASFVQVQPDSVVHEQLEKLREKLKYTIGVPAREMWALCQKGTQNCHACNDFTCCDNMRTHEIKAALQKGE